MTLTASLRGSRISPVLLQSFRRRYGLSNCGPAISCAVSHLLVEPSSRNGPRFFGSAPALTEKPRSFVEDVKPSMFNGNPGAEPDGCSPKLTIGILRETYDKWERRAPLCPSHVHRLCHHNDTANANELAKDVRVRVLVQPSSQRIFSDAEYQQAGAILSEDLSEADVILGVKNVADVSSLLPGKTYFLFAHVIKGQRENMGLLHQILEEKIRLVDYECIATTEHDNPTSTQPKRLVAFGRFAGIAGMNNIFQGLGRRLLASGYSTPFLHAPSTYMYRDLKDASQGVTRMGHEIATLGLPNDLEPLVFAFTGNGNVTKGALEMFQCLPHEMITVEELRAMRQQAQTKSDTKDEDAAAGKSTGHRKVYGVMVDRQDMVRKIHGDTSQSFDEEHYRKHPDEYESIFHQTVAPYCNVIVNGMYWDERYPRLLTKEQVKELCEQGHNSLLAVADISCDVKGSIEFLEKTTCIETPFFHYNPLSGHISNEVSPTAITVMGVDILPTELPKDSSEHFGNSLLPLLEETVWKYKEHENGGLPPLPPTLDYACIASDGKLRDRFGYIEAFHRSSLKEAEQLSGPFKLFLLEGHLFDSGLINKILDVMETHKCDFALQECSVGQNSASSVLLRVQAKDQNQLDSMHQKMIMLTELFADASASIHVYDGDHESSSNTAMKPSSSSSVSSSNGATTSVLVKDEKEQTILVLGAGRVASSLSEYLGRAKNRKVVVASADESEVQEVARAAKHGQGVVIDVLQNKAGLSGLVQQSDVVVSLLPATMHSVVAEECISEKKNLVTASYVSDDIRNMHQRCVDAGITILNEVGLDPGMDHMSAMKIIDDVRTRGGRVISFSSVCGGLPAPEAADNPLRYKFSWSPLGVLAASSNSATYRKGRQTVHIDGQDLLASATPFDVWPDMQLECLPNRDSLLYGDLYGIADAEDIFRGTLRYEGFSSIMHTLKNLGMFRDRSCGAEVWNDVLQGMCHEAGDADLYQRLLRCSGGSKEVANRTKKFLDWLDFTEQPITQPDSLVKSFCDLLEERLRFEDNERDMVLMHHEILAEFEDGAKECHRSSLQLFGDEKMTAMCKSVGYTAAVATDLLLQGRLKNKDGVVLPLTKDIYNPVLEALEEEDLKFEETVFLR